MGKREMICITNCLNKRKTPMKNASVFYVSGQFDKELLLGKRLFVQMRKKCIFSKKGVDKFRIIVYTVKVAARQALLRRIRSLKIEQQRERNTRTEEVVCKRSRTIL